MDIAFIENDKLRVGVAAAYGARVVSLFDKGSGREWMTKGQQSQDFGENAVYGGAEAVGWDECFPTVGRWDGSATPWKRMLRDHGDLWGRPWIIDDAQMQTFACRYIDPLFDFARELRIDGPSLTATYRVTNKSDKPLPYLWALHALLAVSPGDRIELPGVEEVTATYLSRGGRTLQATQLPWHERNTLVPFALADVQRPSSAFAGKFLAGGLKGGRARVGRPGQWLHFAWDRSIGDVGIWLTYGGWPAPGGHNEIAIEPSSAAADHIGQAIEANAKPLAPGERREWTVSLTVSA